VIRAAIVGLGNWGKRLVRSVQGTSNKLRFAAAVSRTPSKHEDFLSSQALRAASDLCEVLADPAIDAIVIATPHSQHHGQILSAAAAGKHVFVEKPLTLTRADAIEAAGALRAKKLTLGVGFGRRFLPAYRALEETVGGRGLGELLHLEGQQSGPSGLRRKPGSWRELRSECPAGAMTGRGIHVLDGMIHLGGLATAVTALSERRVLQAEIDDTTSMMLRLARGATGYLSTIYVTADIWRIQAYGTKGHAEMRGEDTLVTADLAGAVRSVSFKPIDKEKAALEAFADAITGVAAYPVTPEEAVNEIAVLEAIVESARTLKWISIG
jgi:predicted dehydrogenase